MRCLVLGVYYANNLGDAVICDCVASRLRRRFPKAEIVVRDVKARFAFPELRSLTMKQMEYARRREKLRHFVTQYAGWDKERKHEEIRLKGSLDYIHMLCEEPWDLVVFAGGQLFQDGFALFLQEFVRQLDPKGIPVLFNACGTGPTWSAYVRSQLAAALQAPCVKFLSTRDNAQLIQRCYLGRNPREVTAVSDPALWCGQVYQIDRNRDADTIGLGVMYATSVNVRAEIAFWCQMIKMLEVKGARWQLFVNGNDEDIVFAQHILARAGKRFSPEKYLAPIPRNPRGLVETVARYRSIVSFRLHSHVLANALGIPGIAIVWDEKLRFFYEKLGQPERCRTIYDSPEEIWKGLQTAEAEGTAAECIQRQRTISEDLLVAAILRALPQESDARLNLSGKRR